MRPVAHRSTLTAEGSTKGYQRPDLSPPDLLVLSLDRVCRRAQRAGLTGAGIAVAPQLTAQGHSRSARDAVPVATSDRNHWWPNARALLNTLEASDVHGHRLTLMGLQHDAPSAQTLF